MTIEKDTRACLASAGFVPTDLLLIGVSGGPDSLALAHVLYSLGWKIALAHFDHQLRSQSAGDCEFVRKTAEEFGVMFYQASEDIQRKAEKEKRSRIERLGATVATISIRGAEQINAKAVLTANTADDQGGVYLDASAQRERDARLPDADLWKNRFSAGNSLWLDYCC